MVTATVGNKKYINGSGTVQSDGSCKIEFPQTPSGMWWTGGVIIFQSPPGIQWAININGQLADITFADQTADGVQVGPGDILTATAIPPNSNIITGTGPSFNQSPGPLGAYIGQQINATFIVTETDANTTELIGPGHDAFNQFSSYTRVIFNGNAQGVGPNIFFNVEPTDRCLIIFTSSNTAGVASVTSGAGFDYLPMALARRPLGGASSVGNILNGPVYVPIYGVFENLQSAPMNVAFTGAAGYVFIGATPDPVFQQPYQEPQGVVVVNGISGVLGANVPTQIPVLTEDNNHATAFTATQASAGSGLTATLLAAPSAGNYWEIASLGILTTVATTVASAVTLRTLTSLQTMLSVGGPIGSWLSLYNAPHCTISEGIQIDNLGVGVVAFGSVIARQIPQ